MKYIREGFTMVIFSDDVVHSDMAARCRMKPESAGFIKLTRTNGSSIGVQCHGESVSLGVKADPDDSEIAVVILGIQ